jgi:DNA-binding transcriptional MocR family regulator
MLYKVISAARSVSGLKPATKTVFFYLSTYTDNPDGSGVFPGIERLCQETSFSLSTVRRALEELECDGWIKPETFRRQRVKGWRICIEKLGFTPDQLEIKKKGGQPPPLPQPAQVDREAPAPDPAALVPPPNEFYIPDQSPEARAERRRILHERALERMGIQ